MSWRGYGLSAVPHRNAVLFQGTGRLGAATMGHPQRRQGRFEAVDARCFFEERRHARAGEKHDHREMAGDERIDEAAGFSGLQDFPHGRDLIGNASEALDQRGDFRRHARFEERNSSTVEWRHLPVRPARSPP